MAHTGFGLASTTFFVMEFLKSLPSEMMEAAKVDGATHYDTFLKIVVPLSIQLLHLSLFCNFYGSGMIY